MAESVSVQAGGRPPGACRNVRREPGGGGNDRGSAGSLITLSGGSGQASHRDDLAIRSRLDASRVQMDARLEGGGADWTADRACGGFQDPDGHGIRAGQRFKAVFRGPLVRAATDRQAPPVGCGHHPASFGPRASCVTLVHVSDMHTTTHFRKAMPACGPPELPLTSRRIFSRGSAWACPNLATRSR